MPELKLELLNIEGCSSISAEGFAAFMGTQQNLRSINFASSRKILSVIKEEAKSIFTLMNGLRKIDLSMFISFELWRRLNFKKLL